MKNLSTGAENAKRDSLTQTRRIAGLAIFTAVVVVLQLLGSVIRFGPFSISLVLVPIVIGAALYGTFAGAWLGFVFGVVVLLSDAAAFLAVSVPGTILVCLLKGMAAGAAAAFVYRLASKKSVTVGAICAAIVAPICNTGIFLIGCRLFFYETVAAWGAAAGIDNTLVFMLTAFVGGNFVVEMVVNMLLAPTIVRLIRFATRR